MTPASRRPGIPRPPNVSFDYHFHETKDDTAPRRWGSTWLPGDVADRYWKNYADAAAAVDSARRHLDLCRYNCVIANESAEKQFGLGDHYLGHMDQAKAGVDKAGAAILEAQTAVSNAETNLIAIPHPPFPDKFQSVWSEPR